MKRRVRGGKRGTRVQDLPVQAEPAAPVEPAPPETKAQDEAGYVIVPGMRVLVRPVDERLPKRTMLVRAVAPHPRHGWVVSGRELMTLNQIDAPATRCKVAETAADIEDFRKRSKGVDLHRALLVGADPKLMRPTGKTRAQLGLEES